MVDWTTPQDGYVIRAQMMNYQVWERCQLFGGSRLADAIEKWINFMDSKKPSYQIAYDERLKKLTEDIKTEHHGGQSRDEQMEVRPGKDSIQLDAKLGDR